MKRDRDDLQVPVRERAPRPRSAPALEHQKLQVSKFQWYLKSVWKVINDCRLDSNLGWFLKIHNRKCNYPPPSLAIHQKQTESQQQGGQWQKANVSIYPHIGRLCVFSFPNQGQGALPTTHTGGRRLKTEGAGKMSPSSKLCTRGLKNEWKPSC